MKTETCNFSGAKIYPGHGKFVVRTDNKSFRLLNGKCESLFWAKKKPMKIHWTLFSRRLHKKGASEEIAKRRTRKTVKVQRAIVGASWDDILAKRNQPEAVRKAAREAASEENKKKKVDQAKKREEKVKAMASLRAQQKVKTSQSSNKSSRSQARY